MYMWFLYDMEIQQNRLKDKRNEWISSYDFLNFLISKLVKFWAKHFMFYIFLLELAAFIYS